MIRHFVATVYILQEEKVLLLLHPKHNKWLPPGGHLERNETPPECALREAFEETGLRVELIKEEHLWVKQPHAMSFERPFMCLIENIPSHGDHPAHQHVDFIYRGRPISGELCSEGTELRWFTLDEILALQPSGEIFPDTVEAITALFNKVWL